MNYRRLDCKDTIQQISLSNQKVNHKLRKLFLEQLNTSLIQDIKQSSTERENKADL